jgi:hypothetical protein
MTHERLGEVIMLRDRQSAGANSRGWNFWPFTYVYAFFHPVSREALRESLDRADMLAKEADRLTEEHNRLKEQIRLSAVSDNVSEDGVENVVGDDAGAATLQSCCRLSQGNMH